MMRIANGTLLPFTKLCLYSGVFAVFSFLFFAMVYHFANPEAVKLVAAIKGNTFNSWLAFNFGSWTMALLSVGFLATTIVSAALGFATGIVARAFHGKAADVLKRGIQA